MKRGKSRAPSSKSAQRAKIGAVETKEGEVSSNSDVLQKARQKFESFYLWFPVVPFLGRGTSAILYATACLYLFFTAFVFLATPKIEPQMELLESALSKNTVLQLLPGETYAYEISSQQSNASAYYEVYSSASCSGVKVVEKLGTSQSAICILSSGNLAENGFENVNSGFGNSSMLLFSPWMLAASENFSWQLTTRVSAGGVQINIPTVFRSLGIKKTAGRDAYEISVQSENEPSSKIYVDAEKRVTLLFEAGGVSAKLVSAPFALDWGNRSSVN